MNNPHNLSTALLFTNGAYDKNCYPLTTMDELQQLTSHEYYQRQLAAYRSGDGEAKKRLAALIPQGRLKNETIRLHQMEHLVPSGWVFLDDDRPHTEITAEQRHALVEERLAQVGLRTIPHVAQRSASMKYHLLVPMLDTSRSIADNHAQWARLMEGILVLDPSTVNVNRLMFLTGEWLTPVDALLAPILSPQGGKPLSSMTEPLPPGGGREGAVGSLSAIAQRLLLHLCGTTTPPEGTRNTTLYEAARQMAYLEGITEQEITEAFRPLAFLGLPETEARSCIRSAMKREKTWLYTLPPELARAMEQTHPIPPCEGGGSDNAEAQVLPVREDLGGSIPSLPPLVSLFTSLVPEHTREAAASMIFAPLGSYLSNTVTIDDVSGQERNIQFTSIVVGNSSSGKGFAGTLSDLITERHRQHDISSWAQLTAWQEQKRTTPKGEAAPPKPDVPLYLLASNMTEPALLERLKALEPHHGRAYINVPEIDDLRKMQTVATSRIGAGQEIILSAFDTARYGALRVSADAVSTITVMSLNIVATSTYPGTQDFFRGGIERGSVGRCDISIVPDCYDVPHYGRPTPELYAQLDIYIDRLQQATGHIQCDDIDRVIEEIRLAYNDPQSPLSHYQNAEYYKLCHRQLLITKQKATLLYICNDYQWDPTWEPWLHHAFYYGMECKISVFKSEIESWIKRQYASLTATVITRSGPKSELDNLPQTFTLDDIVAMKRSASPTDTDEQLTTKAKTLIRTWKLRQRIIPTEQEGVWEKV
ncbi:MAG: hypothetical protein IIX50_07305 [Bacteroidaceae bacterium]|nr:hypothetical protein [Bacteroidaceae bacterium]